MFLAAGALILLTLAGALAAWPVGREPRVRLGSVLAQGLLIGTLATGAVGRGFEHAGITGYAWPWLIALTVLAAAAVRRHAALLREARAARWDLPGRALLIALLLLAAFAVAEATLRPPFPWDAWNAWLMRARAAFLEPGARFVAPHLWVAGDGRSVELSAAHYPGFVAGMVTWISRLLGAWRPEAAAIAWPMAWLGLLGLFAGVVSQLGASAGVRRILVLVLALTPLPFVHALLYGYMDLWIAGALLLATAAAIEAVRGGGPRPLHALTLLPLLMLKVEGVVWSALLIAAVLLLRRRRLGVALIAVATLPMLAVLVFVDGGVTAFGGTLVVKRDFLAIPYLGASPLEVHDLIGPLLETTFLSATFGVVFPLLAATLVLGVVARVRGAGPLAPDRRVLALFLIFAVGFLLVLFGLTIAGRWATEHTALSRVMMQLVPVALLLATGPLERVMRPRRDQTERTASA